MTAILIVARPPAALCGRSGRLGRKGPLFLPNLPLLRHKVAGGVAIMRIADDMREQIDSVGLWCNPTREQVGHGLGPYVG